MKISDSMAIAGSLLLSLCAEAEPAGPPPQVLRYGPSAHVRSVLLSGESARYPYPGTAAENAVQAGYDDVLVRLLANPERRRAEGPGALLAAIQAPDPRLVGLILAIGVSPNDIAGGGAGALAYAVIAGENRTLCLLADYGVDLTPAKAPHQPMLAAVVSGNLDAAQLLRLIGYVPSDEELARLRDLGKGRGYSKLWEGLLSIAADDDKAIRLCQRINAVPAAPTRLR